MDLWTPAQMPSVTSFSSDRDSLGAPWLIRIRWAAAFGQLLVFLGALFAWGVSLSWGPLIAVSFVIVVSNLLLLLPQGTLWLRKRSSQGIILSLDVFLLTGLLFFYGGHTNPFSMAYLIHVVLAALLLGAGWTWGVSILCSILYALLFVWYVPVPELSMGHHHGGGGPEFNLHLQGMLAGFVLISFLISGFLQKMRAEIDWREKELVRRRSNEEKLAAVTTVSASVAHELGTPLGSMMLVVSDMQEELRSGRNGGAIREDLEVIRQQLERCAEAITRLGQNSGELFGEMPLEFSLESVFKSLGERLTDGQRARVDFSSGPGLRPVILPKEGLQHVLHALVKNALEASGEQTRVLVSGEEKGEALCLRIQDSGAGMSQEDLKRVGEPFFTTKDSGRGMGLGLFIAKLFTERLGGTFDIVSTLGMGTRVEMQLPRVTSWKATP